MYSEFVRYLIKNGSTVGQCISNLLSSIKSIIGLVGKSFILFMEFGIHVTIFKLI